MRRRLILQCGLGSASRDDVLQKYNECLAVYILYFNLTTFSLILCLYCAYCLFILVCAYCLFMFVCAYCLSICVQSPCSPSRALDWHLKSIETLNYTIKGQCFCQLGFHCSFDVQQFMCTFQHQYYIKVFIYQSKLCTLH